MDCCINDNIVVEITKYLFCQNVFWYLQDDYLRNIFFFFVYNKVFLAFAIYT